MMASFGLACIGGRFWLFGGIWRVAVVRSLRTPPYFPTPSGACSGSWFMIRFSHDASIRALRRAWTPGVRLASFLLFFSMILRRYEAYKQEASKSQNHAINYIHKQHIISKSQEPLRTLTLPLTRNNHHEQRPRPIFQSRQRRI